LRVGHVFVCRSQRQRTQQARATDRGHFFATRRDAGHAPAELFRFDGDRETARRQTVAAALRGVLKILTR